MCIWSTGDCQVSSLTSNQSAKKSRKTSYIIPEIFFVVVVQVKVEPLAALNWRGITLLLNPEKTQPQTNRQTNKHPHTNLNPLPLCYFPASFHILGGGYTSVWFFFSLPNLLFCCCCCTSSLGKILHPSSGEQRTVCSLFLPTETWQSLAHKWREASHLAFDNTERDIWIGIHPAQIQSPVMWCLFTICQPCNSRGRSRLLQCGGKRMVF